MMLVSACCAISGWAKDDENGKKTPEELTAESAERSTVAGKFRFDRASQTDGKELPKVVGTITQESGLTYQVIAEDKSFLDVLSNSDGREVTLCGKVAFVQEKGAFLMADSKITAPVRPTTRKKRGGL